MNNLPLPGCDNFDEKVAVTSQAFTNFTWII